MKCKKYYRDMEKFKKARNRQKQRYYGRTENAENRNQPWTVRELEIVMEHNYPDMVISDMIGRSVRAIQIMRHKENKSIALREAEMGV